MSISSLNSQPRPYDSSSVPPPPPPPPPSVEELQQRANTPIEQLNKNPNDAEAKNVLAHVEREIGNELAFEHGKGDSADPKRLEALEKTLGDIHAAMQKFGVSELPKGGGYRVD